MFIKANKPIIIIMIVVVRIWLQSTFFILATDQAATKFDE